MSDVAISYSAADAQLALKIAAGLRERGISVWMDDATPVEEGIGGIGVPVGQEHWAVISQAIDEASVLLVVDTYRWRGSEYCRREYLHAVEGGKAVAVHRPAGEPADVLEPDGSLEPIPSLEFGGTDEFAERVRAIDALAEAHSRLLKAGAVSRHRRLPILRHPRAADAIALALGDPATAGLRLTPAIEATIAEVLDDNRRRRRLGILSGSVLALSATILAVVAVFGWTAAVRDREAAESAARTQLSLLTAEQALVAPTTGEAQALVRTGIDAADTTAIRRAERFVAAAARERIVAQVPVNALYRGLAVVEDASLVVVSTDTDLLVVDTATGVVSHRFTMPSRIGPVVELLPDLSAAIVLTRSTAGLVEVDVATGELTTRSVGAVTAFTVDSEGVLWWAELDGSIHRSAAVGDDDVVARLDGEAVFTALEVEAESGVLYAFDRESDLTTFTGAVPGSGRLTAESTIELRDARFGLPVAEGEEPYFPPEPADLSDGQPEVDLIVACEGTVVVHRDNTYWTVDRQGEVVSKSSLTSTNRSLACFRDAGITTQSVFNDVVTFPETAIQPAGIFSPAEPPGRYLMASSAGHGTLAVLHASGEIELIRTAAVGTVVQSDTLRMVIPWLDQELTIDADDVLRDGAGNTVAMLGPQDPRHVAVTESRLALTEDSSIVIVHADGSVGRYDLPTGTILVDLQPGSDGRFIATTLTGYAILEPVPSGNPLAETPVQSLQADEAVMSATLSADGTTVGVVTSSGRVLLVGAGDGAVREETTVTATGEFFTIVFAPGPNGEHLLVPAGDGYLRAFDASLVVTARTWLGSAGTAMTLSRSGATAILALRDQRLLVVDTSTLEVQQVLAEDIASAYTYRLTEDESSVVGLDLRLTDHGIVAELGRLPVWL